MEHNVLPAILIASLIYCTSIFVIPCNVFGNDGGGPTMNDTSGDFQAEIKQGKLGVKFSIPTEFELKQSAPRGARYHDTAHQVLWHIKRFPWLLDISSDHDEILRRDIAEAARYLFQLFYNDHQKAASESIETPPRTDDPDWSPIIQVSYDTLDSTAVLSIIHRLSYRPGSEIIAGHVLIPMTHGMYVFSAYSSAEITGLKESILADRLLSKHPVPRGKKDIEAALAPLDQKEIDNPDHDALFTNHPLSRVRAALRWFIGLEKPVLSITQPMPASISGPLELAGVGVSIIPPPRYLPTPQRINTAQNLVSFIRVGLPDVHPRDFDIWRVPGESITGFNRQKKLIKTANTIIQGWEREGAADIQIEVRDITKSGKRIQLFQYVKYKVATGPVQSAIYWLLDEDGVLFRITVGGPLYISKDELFSDLNQIVASFQRLD